MDVTKHFWSFRVDSAGKNELHIDGGIAMSQSWWSDEITPKQFQAQLDRLQGELTVWINSPGGDAFAGAAIYTALREYAQNDKVTVKVSGIAASAASIIAMAGDEVLISPVGTIMIHDPWAYMRGNSRDMRQYADTMDEIRDGQIAAYAHKTGKSNDEIRQLMERETYMNATSAVANGFADAILYDDPEAGTDPAAYLASAAWMFSQLGEEKRMCALLDQWEEKANPQSKQTDPPPEPDDTTARQRMKLLALSID